VTIKEDQIKGKRMSIDFNRRFWNEKIETLSADEMGALQLKRLKKQVVYNYEHSLFYRKKFEEGGAKPEDIRDVEDFRCIPLTTKDEQRRSQEESIEQFGHPYSPLAITCAPLEKMVRINSTSGTTGIPTLYTLTQHDVDVVNEMHARKFWMAGIRPGHVILQCLSLSMFTGGLPLSQGIMSVGACAVPVGIEGGSKRVLEFARITASAAIFATPSFGLYLIEESPKLIGKAAAELGIKWFFTAGEPGGGNPDVRKRLSEGFGGARVFDHTGGGHGFHGATCEEPPESYSGMHFMSGDHCLVELVDPKTKKNIEIENGAIGELVLTFLDWEGGPFMRYAYGDILQVFTGRCACGRTGMKFKILGRADDMLIVKGVNIYPSSIKDGISRFYPRTTGVVKIVLDQPGPLVRPPLKIRVEYGAQVTSAEVPSLEEEIGNYFRETFRVHPEIEWAPPHSISLETGKTGKVKLVEIVRRGETQE
jgi:phenylacetate-CoA ligase